MSKLSVLFAKAAIDKTGEEHLAVVAAGERPFNQGSGQHAVVCLHGGQEDLAESREVNRSERQTCVVGARHCGQRVAGISSGWAITSTLFSVVSLRTPISS